MIRINKNLLSFAIVTLFLGLAVVMVSSKFLPLFFQHSVYFCQQFIDTFSIQIPHQLGYIVFGALTVMVLMTIYKFVFIFFEVEHLRANLRSYKKPTSRLHSLLRKIHLEGKVSVIQSEKPFAFCVGILHQKIYISTTLLFIMSKKELEAILLHEKYHLKNKDSLIMLFASIVQSLFPFFPLTTDLLTQYKINREIEADWEAVQELGDTYPLVSVLKKFLSFPAFSLTTASSIANYETLEPRINALVKREKKLLGLEYQVLSLVFY